MPDGRTPGPMCIADGPLICAIDEETMCRAASAIPVPNGTAGRDWALERALAAMEAEALNFAMRFLNIESVRQQYLAEVQRLSRGIRDAVKRGELTPKAGAELAHEVRNEILAAMRLRSMDLGKAVAEKMKSRVPSLPELQERYAMKRFGRAFAELAEGERNAVYLEIIEASGRARPSATLWASRLGKVGRGLGVLAVGVAVYNIASADDKLRATAQEATTFSGGVLGGMGGGALAGLACGPGAPVCVGVGVFVGGALVALGFGEIFDRVWREAPRDAK